MVGIVKYIATAVVTVLLAVATVAAQGVDPNDYELLLRQQRRLQLRAEQVSERLARSREAYNTMPSDSLALEVSSLEYQYLLIVERSRTVRNELAKADSLIAAAELALKVEQSAMQQKTNVSTQNPSHDRFRAIETLFADDEKLIPLLVESYRSIHGQATDILESYRSARNLADADSAGKLYAHLTAKAKNVADSIAYKWDDISLEKSNALVDLADSLGLSNLKEDYAVAAHRSEQQMEEFVKRYSDGDVAMYPLRKRDLIDFERRIAAAIGLSDVADSLAQVATQLNEEEYRFEPLRSIQTPVAEFEESVIATPARYKSTKSIVEVPVPTKGYVFSILLGSFKEEPQIGVFRSAAPLFSERRPDGRTYYYTGLYPTEFSTADAVARLRNAGFKNPTVVMWYKGIRRDDFTPTVGTPKSTIYKVEITGADSILPEQVLEIVRQEADGKELSKSLASDGTYTFTVGQFTKRKTAEALAKSIGKLMKSKVIEIVI